MSPPAPQSVRRRFLVAVGHGLYLTWPVLSGILVLEVALGLLIGFVEGWSLGEAVYFSFITQNRAVYSFAAQTSPIPAAIERRYVGVGNRSQPLGRDGSAHILGHCRQSWLEVPQGVRGSGGSNGAAALEPGFRRRPPRRGRGLLSRARPLLRTIFQQGIQPARGRGRRAGAEGRGHLPRGQALQRQRAHLCPGRESLVSHRGRGVLVRPRLPRPVDRQRRDL